MMIENKFNSFSDNNITLAEWLSSGYSSEEIHTLFVNMDKAMKYLHEKGFCIDSFNPNNIEILNGSLNQIRFMALGHIPVGSAVVNKEYVRDDIGRTALLQIGIYANCLNNLNPSFLKENFERFEMFLPERDIPYYKGVVERRAAVYFSDYVAEKSKRDLEGFEAELNEVGGAGKGVSLVKSNGHSLVGNDTTNKKINDSIYRDLNGINNSAYISLVAIPFIIAVLGLLFMLIMSFS